MSVLTAWAAGKFSGATIGKFIKQSGFEQQVTRRDLVIPGYVAQISGELEESLPGWKVIVGPQEAADLESFVKNRLNPSAEMKLACSMTSQVVLHARPELCEACLSCLIACAYAKLGLSEDAPLRPYVLLAARLSVEAASGYSVPGVLHRNAPTRPA